jgi:hypothetical protein
MDASLERHKLKLGPAESNERGTRFKVQGLGNQLDFEKPQVLLDLFATQKEKEKRT